MLFSLSCRAGEEEAELLPPTASEEVRPSSEASVPAGSEAGLVWTEVMPEVSIGGPVEWADGNFFVLGEDEDGLQVFRSGDGVDWEVAGTLPAGFFGHRVQASGSNLSVVASPAVGEEDPAPLTDHGFFSSDEGETWIDLGPIGDAPEGPAEYLSTKLVVFDSSIAGDVVLFLTSTWTTLDMAAVLEDRGLEVPGDGLRYTYSDGMVTFCNPEDCDDGASFTLDELGLDADVFLQASQSGPNILYRSVAGAPAEPVEPPSDDEVVSLSVAGTRFVATTAATDLQPWISKDGLSWEQAAPPPEGIATIEDNGSSLVAIARPAGGEPDAPPVVVSSDDAQSWDVVATDTTSGITSATAGVAGFFVYGHPFSEQGILGWSSDGEGWTWQTTIDAFEGGRIRSAEVGSTGVVATVEFDLIDDEGRPLRLTKLFVAPVA